MKILHTSDVHIARHGDERWAALEKVLRQAKNHQVDVVVIAGDLFDSSAQAEQIRPHLRTLFDAYPFPILILPGNHDAQAFQQGFYWGGNSHVFTDFSRPYEMEEVCFWGIPYQEMAPEKLLTELYQQHQRILEQEDWRDKTHVLLFHGELEDVAGHWEAFGEEGIRRYMPIRLAAFRNLVWNYVLAGHFHSQYDAFEFRPNAYFVYPGSPISITRKEMGPRQVNMLEVGKAPRAVPIDTPYYTTLSVTLSPEMEHLPLEQLQRQVEALPEHARVIISIQGLINSTLLGLSEQDIHNELERLQARYSTRIDNIEHNFLDIGLLVEDPLYREFEERLQNYDEIGDASDRDLIRQYFLNALREVKYARS